MNSEDTKPSIIMPGDTRRMKNDDDDHLPPALTRDDLGTIFEDFVDEHLYDTKEFLKHFGNKRAIIMLPVPSLLDLVKASVCYDAADKFDLRLLVNFVGPVDRKLFIDLATNVSERFVNNYNKPKSPLTLMQFKVLLAYRMNQVGF